MNKFVSIAVFTFLLTINFIYGAGQTCYQFETPHFVVHYYKGVEQTAFKAATIAEEIYGPITQLYQYEPSTKKNKTRLIFKDSEDYSNGGAYYFDNKIEIWAENLDFVLRGTHDWLRDVITHEFAHIVSLRKSLKLGTSIPGIYFQYFHYETEKRPDVVRGFPDAIASFPYMATSFPVWFAEGVAQYQSNALRYDYRDSHREMLLRDRILTGNMLSLNEMNTFGKNSVGNESSYNLGFAFVKYLADTYGEDKLRLLAERSSKIADFTFEQSMKKVFGKSSKELYNEWIIYLKSKYKTQVAGLKLNIFEGDIVEDRGFGNIYPLYSPDGNSIAYVTNEDAPSFGDNSLVIAEKTNQGFKKRIIDHDITSSITWSPDGNYLVYARRGSFFDIDHPYNDLFIYDLKEDRRDRISKNMRLRNPDWRPDSNEVAAVIGHDGNTNLVLIEIDIEKIRSEEFTEKNSYGFHLEQHEAEKYSIFEGKTNFKQDDYHQFYIKSDKWRLLTEYYNGRQIYHPRWSPDGKRLITDSSTEFTRNIEEINLVNGQIIPLISGKCDYRNPAWSSDGRSIYFASDTTGIFNIYNLPESGGEITPMTNVSGGAFWPSVNNRGELIFGFYKNQGYGINLAPGKQQLALSEIIAVPDYKNKVLHTPEPVKLWQPGKITKTKLTKSNFLIFPRILIDYGTFKPGIYLFSNELLNRLSFLGSVDVNADKDIFLYGQFEYNLFERFKRLGGVFFEIYNQHSNIDDIVEIPQYFDTPKRNVNFNLMELVAGIGKTLYFEESPQYFAWDLSYSFSNYKAKLEQFAIKKPVETGYDFYAPVRYTYLKGHAIKINYKIKSVKPTLERMINPQDGFYAGIELAGHSDKFLNGFNTSASSNLEEYDTYNYLQGKMELEGYLKTPWLTHHTFAAKIQLGYTSAKVDSFFNFFAGGLIGLKGYPFYSIEGRNMAIGSMYYRFPLIRNMNKRLGILYFKHLYGAPFFQAGNAWNPETNALDDIKRSVGVQLRMEFNAYYFMPLKLFYEAAYPLDKQVNKSITYDKQWRHYVGLLFNFDLRMTGKNHQFRR